MPPKGGQSERFLDVAREVPEFPGRPDVPDRAVHVLRERGQRPVGLDHLLALELGGAVLLVAQVVRDDDGRVPPRRARPDPESENAPIRVVPRPPHDVQPLLHRVVLDLHPGEGARERHPRPVRELDVPPKLRLDLLDEVLDEVKCRAHKEDTSAGIPHQQPDRKPDAETRALVVAARELDPAPLLRKHELERRPVKLLRHPLVAHRVHELHRIPVEREARIVRT